MPGGACGEKIPKEKIMSLKKARRDTDEIKEKCHRSVKRENIYIKKTSHYSTLAPGRVDRESRGGEKSWSRKRKKILTKKRSKREKKKGRRSVGSEKTGGEATGFIGWGNLPGGQRLGGLGRGKERKGQRLVSTKKTKERPHQKNHTIQWFVCGVLKHLGAGGEREA